MSDSIASEIMSAEARRCAFMVAGDPIALSGVLDEDLQFHHATGAVDDKADFLAKMASGRIVYQTITWSEEKVISLGDNAALLTGRMLTEVKVEGDAKLLRNRVMTVWSRGSGAWRLLAFQSTPIAG